MKILITGGTVFASRYTAEYFVKKDHNVYILNRGSKPQPDGAVPIIADRRSLGDKLKEHEFDAVFDITAYNAQDVSDLLDGLGGFGTYIMISSSAVYPETLPQPFTEEMQCGENIWWGAYGTNKLAAENILLARASQAYVIRPPYLCGPMNNLYRESFVFDCAEQGLPIYLPQNGQLPLQFFDIEDMCRFIEVLIKEKPKHHIFNVGNSDAVSAEKWAKICCSVLGAEPNIRYASNDINAWEYFPFRNYAYRLDVSKMHELMPDTKPLSESIAQSYEWYKNNRELVVKKGYLDYIRNTLLSN